MKTVIAIKKKTSIPFNDTSNSSDVKSSVPSRESNVFGTSNSTNISSKDSHMPCETSLNKELLNSSEWFSLLPKYRQNKIEFLQNKIDYLMIDDIKLLEQTVYDKLLAEYPQVNLTIFTNMYNNLMRHLWVNLDPTAYLQNTYLKNSVLDGSIQIKDIPYLSNRELYPDKWRAYNKREEIELHYQINGEAYVPTTLFTCKRCKKNKCKYFQLQVRSCDEGMTNFITCMNCNNHWKQNN